MNVALQSKNVYEDFEPKSDILYFKVGAHGLISFHGRNYNIKKRMSSDDGRRLMNDEAFLQISSDCYVNVGKITHLAEDCLIFGDSAKRISCSKRKQQLVKQLLGGLHQLV